MPVAGPGKDRISCPQCKQSIASSRTASHLEKCLGMGRRAVRKTIDRGEETSSEEEKSVKKIKKVARVLTQESPYFVSKSPIDVSD